MDTHCFKESSIKYSAFFLEQEPRKSHVSSINVTDREMDCLNQRVTLSQKIVVKRQIERKERILKSKVYECNVMSIL